jgi:hypothetical protein
MIKHIIPLFLFFLLTPGILWTYSKKTNKYFIGLLHAVLFVFIWQYVPNFTREGMEQAKDKEPAKDKKKVDNLTFVLGDNLSSDSEVINKINAMEGPPKIEGADQIFGDGKSYLLFKNQRNKTNKLDDLIKNDILDPEMRVINKFIKFHKDYPDI